ncbi:MAG: hypothetical protein HY689_13870 [Chloroflexi bacterium]|nr:hypothetical protein [Chloroflexota bacterium]
MEFNRDRLARIEAAAAQLEERYPEEVAEEREAGTVPVPEFLRGLARDLRTYLQRDFALRWRELRALETVWSEIDEEFDGEPASARQVRELAARTKEKLLALAEALAPQSGARRLPSPKPEFVDELREVVRQTYGRLGWVAPEDENPEPDRGRTHGRQSR